MGVKLLIAFSLAILHLLSSVNAQYGACDYEGRISAAGQSLTINHLTTTGNCRYKIFSPVDTFMEATCSVNLQGTCENQNLTISRSGEKDLRDGLNYCNGVGTFVSQSIGNEFVFSFRSLVGNSGSFNCKIVAVAPTNANCDCSWNVNSKIVGGTPTGVNEFTPHAALIDRYNAEPFCGAVIIKQNWAITAAHCVDASSGAASTALLVGDHNLDTGADTKWAAGYLITRFIPHSLYNAETNLNDIALVQTSGYIRYTPGVSPGCLPYTFNMYNFTGKSLNAVGWGTTSSGGIASRILLKVSLPVVTNAYCASKMDNIDYTKLCTFAQGRDTCGRDSGGGLYWYASRYYPIAIVNYGYECASNFPGVNSRITSYIGWIEANVGGFFCRKT